MSSPTLDVTRGGTLVLRQESGNQSKLGLRLTGDRLIVFDRITKEWLPIPRVLSTREGDYSVEVSFTPRGS